MITQAGFSPKTIKCEIHKDEASGRVAKNLEIEEGAPIFIVNRLRLATDKPIVWSQDMLPAVVLDGRMPRERELETQSLYDYLEKNQGIRIFQGTAVLRPILAPKDVAEKLQIHRNDILLLISQTDYDENHRPVIYSDEYHLSDKITFLIHRKGPHR
jgi:GntR family transcriptional regulator